MKKFRTFSNHQITEYEVVKETEKQIVYLNERGREMREAKISDWASWHDTKSDAKDYLTTRELRKVKNYSDQIEYCKSVIEKIKLL